MQVWKLKSGGIPPLISKAIARTEKDTEFHQPEKSIFVYSNIAEIQRSDYIFNGVQFSATMQLRTPLRVLLHHGEIHSKMPDDIIIRSQWEGIWLPATKTFSELGINMLEPEGIMASQIGYIPSNGGYYLPFLIRVREIVETVNSVEWRIAELKTLLAEQIFVDPINSSGGISAVIDYFFPLFIYTLPGLTELHRKKMIDLDLLTPRKILDEGSPHLLAMKGIGHKKLNDILMFCSTSEFQDDKYIDRVER
ncbi:hypothetical protein ACO0LB_10165 [Undibacterium sp. SXout7W]|uniref:hypothetical protein n=1 Tax=Undibacterium sp. SXout7W TaxID=3413049 RepID=UPI003BF1ED18